MTLVLDASVVVELLAGAPTLTGMVRGEELWSTHLMPFEVLNVLRRRTLAGYLVAEAADAMASDLGQLPVTLVAANTLSARIWELRGCVTTYDASYVALAHLLDCPLVTLDGRLARAVDGVCRVIVA